MKTLRWVLGVAVAVSGLAAPTAAQAAPSWPKCVISVSRHFTQPPGDKMYVTVTHACPGQKARVLATCLHYQNNGTVTRTPEKGRWASALKGRSTIGCRLGAYADERWQRDVDHHVYTTKFG